MRYKGDNKLEWKLYDKDGKFLQEINCQYDACDIATMIYNATEIKLDFKNKKANILRIEGDED